MRVAAWARAHPGLVDAFLAVALLLACGLGVTTSAEVGKDALPAWWTWSVQAAMALPLAWRRRAPLAVFAVSALAAGAQALVGPPLGAEAALLVALYTLAALDGRRTVLAAAGLVFAIGAAVTVARDTPGDGNALLGFVSLGAAALAAAALGTAARVRRAQLAAAVEHAARDERARIAREMHDIVAHNLAVVVALADGAAHAAQRDPAGAREAIRQIGVTGRQALEETRRVVGVLRERDDPDDTGPQPGLADLAGLVAHVRGAGLAARLHVAGEEVPLAPGAQLTVFRLVQEALTNVLKHADGARAADVRLAFGPRALEVEVADDGAPARAAPAGGHGLSGLRERAAVYGAAIEAGPVAGGGWRVRATLPLDLIRAS